jgi:hypothetical protein
VVRPGGGAADGQHHALGAIGEAVSGVCALGAKVVQLFVQFAIAGTHMQTGVATALASDVPVTIFRLAPSPP